MANPLRRLRAWLESRPWRAKGKGLETNEKSDDPPSGDTPSQEKTPPSSDTLSQPDPPLYCRGSGLRLTWRPIRPFDNSLSIIHAAVGVAALYGGSAAAEQVATVIDNVVRCVAAVPAADARATANVITNAVTTWAFPIGSQSRLPIATICEQACDSVSASSAPHLAERLPQALHSFRQVLSCIETGLASNIAHLITHAVQSVTCSVALSFKNGSELEIADAWSDGAFRAITISNGGATTSSGALPFPGSAGDGGSSTNTSSKGCEAVLQTARLQAAIGALRNYGENAQVLGALDALDAVAAADPSHNSEEGLSGVARCTCSKSLRSCNALLQANRLRAALHALWAYNTNVGNHEVVNGLVAIAAAAGLSVLPGDQGF